MSKQLTISQIELPVKRKVHNEILTAIRLITMTADGYLKDLIKAISKGEIPNLFIKY